MTVLSVVDGSIGAMTTHVDIQPASTRSTAVTAVTAVTGGASGLGLIVAEHLLGAGRGVVLIDADAEALFAACTALRSRFAPSVAGIAADLSTRDGIGRASDSLADHDVGALVNNAGGWISGDQYPDAAPDDWMSGLTLNLLAPMLLTQRLWSRLAAAGGAVVTIGSSGGVGDEAYGSPEYGAAKAGVRRWTASLGDRADVRVMCVVPGWIGLARAGPEWAALPTDERTRVGPLIPPDDIAAVVLDLLGTGRPGEVVEMLRAGQRVSSTA